MNMAAKKKITLVINRIHQARLNTVAKLDEILYEIIDQKANIQKLKNDTQKSGNLTLELAHAYEMIVNLLQNKEELRIALSNAISTLEDPSIKHAVQVKSQIDQLQSTIDELKNEITSHLREYQHEYNPYY